MKWEKAKWEQAEWEQTEAKAGYRLDRQCVFSKESSVAFSRSIGMELDSEGSIVSPCTELGCYITHQ